MITGTFIEFACADKSCAPPPVGTGGSKPSVGGVNYMDELVSRFGVGIETSDSYRMTPKLRVPNMGRAFNMELRGHVWDASMRRLGEQLEGKIDWSKFKGYGSLPISPGDYQHRIGQLVQQPPDSVGKAAYQRAFEEGTVAEFAAKFKSVTGVPFETVLAVGVSHAWIMGPGVYPERIMQMHRVAADVLPQNGKHASPDILELDGTPIPKDASWIPEDAMRTVMKQMYENTQADLAERGIDEVTLVRGFRAPGDGSNGVSDVDVQLRPLSSYTTRFNGTIPFWGDKGTTGGVDHPVVVVTKVPRKYIFATPYQGPASWDESEVTVLGGTFPSRAYTSDSSRLTSELVSEWNTQVTSELDV
jgi:hypothetical protein